MSGTLYIVATPIGNLEDVSPRALRTLREVRCIACEDTRRTRRLLQRFGVAARTVSCHKFNERDRLERVLGILRDDGDVALVSDGGTPAISDPGALLVRRALEEGLRVATVPGPSAAIALLSASGIPADRFLFDGFLPHRAGERRRRLRELRELRCTLVVFDAPHRIRQSLRDIAEVLGDRRVALGRELTKIHETILAGTAAELLQSLEGAEPRGEFTLVIAGADSSHARAARDSIARRVRQAWREALESAGGDRRTALRAAARTLGMGRAELQRHLAELGEG